MSLLLETIRIHNRCLEKIECHNERFNRSRYELFGAQEPVDLNEIIEIPVTLDTGIYKCRLIYSDKIHNIEFLPYRVKHVRTLKIVAGDHIDYSYKYLDRSCFKRLMEGSPADDILIIQKGLITDTSFSNIAFTDGEKWLTPSTPLLNGTRRMALIREGKVVVEEIKKEDLKFFQFAKLMNAMLDWEESPLIPLDKMLP